MADWRVNIMAACRSRSQLRAGAVHRAVRMLACAMVVLLPAAALLSAPTPGAVLLTLDGAVSPATADYAVRGIRKAAEQGAALVVLRMDTPGGLDTSMRQIIREILAAPLPVVAYVGPSGARAASAGTYILYASHIAAMAPGTNLGAATPVQIGMPGSEPDQTPRDKDRKKDKKANDGKAEDEKDPPSQQGTLTRKQIHDAAAYIRSLAQLRGRNAEWGEKAVREAVSLSAQEAKQIDVIDLVAQDVNDLLKQLNGRKVTVQGVERTLQTDGAAVTEIAPDWRTELLAIITNPSVALLLMMIGIYGLIFEFSNPGFVLPGVVGGICLLLAAFALQLLPINYAGLGLILLGLAFIVSEAFLPSFGALGIGGTIALIIGAVMLIEPEARGYGVSIAFVVALGLTSALVVFTIVAMAVKARKRQVVSGREHIMGATGVVLEDMQTEGWARVQGESWHVLSTTPLSRGEAVRVTGIEGLTLNVEPERPERR
jgi:membrane-bound serine protease (ClpP class)